MRQGGSKEHWGVVSSYTLSMEGSIPLLLSSYSTGSRAAGWLLVESCCSRLSWNMWWIFAESGYSVILVQVMIRAFHIFSLKSSIRRLISYSNTLLRFAKLRVFVYVLLQIYIPYCHTLVCFIGLYEKRSRGPWCWAQFRFDGRLHPPRSCELWALTVNSHDLARISCIDHARYARPYAWDSRSGWRYSLCLRWCPHIQWASANTKLMWVSEHYDKEARMDPCLGACLISSDQVQQQANNDEKSPRFYGGQCIQHQGMMGRQPSISITEIVGSLVVRGHGCWHQTRGYVSTCVKVPLLKEMRRYQAVKALELLSFRYSYVRRI